MMVIRIKRTTETRPILKPCERRGENLVAFWDVECSVLYCIL